jgi:hypothetical protein
MSAVKHDTKTPATLIALARTRRLQRALAHAALHRNAPLPTLHSSLGYMTGTARIARDAAALGHRMTVLGTSRSEGVAYIVEDIGDDAPVVYRLHLRGPRQGHLVPLHAWYEHSDRADLRRRIASITPTLEPVVEAAPEAWMLSTRIVQRRALRIAASSAHGDLPIRKFALQLVVEPVGAPGPSGRTTVTAFLSPAAQLAEVWTLASGREPACDAAIARVTYTGIPSGTGLSKDTVILLTSGRTGMDLDLRARSAC